MPARLTAWGLPAVALSEIVTAAVRLPEAVGVKTTVIVQKPDDARVAGKTGQVLVWLKSPALAPVTLMLVMVKLWLPVFVRFTACEGLDVSSG